MTYTQPTYPISLIDTERMICKLVYKTLVKNTKTTNQSNDTLAAHI